MKYKVGTSITVKTAPGGGIRSGDSRPVMKIGREGDPDCYGVLSPCDGEMYFLREDEVELSTNAEYVRSMGDVALALFMFQIVSTGRAAIGGKELKTVDDCKAWLKESVPVVDAAN